MDTLHYEKLLGDMEERITTERDKKEEKEKIFKSLQRVRNWKDGLEKKAEELSGLGLAVPEEAMAALMELRKDEKALLDQLDDGHAVEGDEGEEEAAHILAQEKSDVVAILNEIHETDMERLDPDERWAHFEIWSIRWRTTAETIGQDATKSDGQMKAAYAQLRELMETWKEGQLFLPAINENIVEDWDAHLERALRRLADVRRRTSRRDVAEDRLKEVSDQISRGDTSSSEDQRILRHRIREAAREPSLRIDLADILADHRELIGDEFDHLWPKDEDEEPLQRKKKITRREIVHRMLRRMKSKALIGGSHGPMEAMHRGFPADARATAKEAMSLLVGAGIIRQKGSVKGARVSIEPVKMRMVEIFLETRKGLMDAALDGWMEDVA